jgi:hypothetical protein
MKRRAQRCAQKIMKYLKIYMTTELLPHQISFIKKCQEGIKLLKEKEQEKGDPSVALKIIIEYPRTNKQSLGLTTSIKIFLKRLQEERLNFFVLAGSRRVAKMLAPHEKFGSWRTIGSATTAIDPKTIDSEYLIIDYDSDDYEKDLDLYLKLNKKKILITTESIKQEQY